MVVVILGHPCRDEIIIAGEKSYEIGGPSYYQAHVFRELGYNDFLVICHMPAHFLNVFPPGMRVCSVITEAHHIFTNEYPDKDNPDIRIQSSNFPKIPITVPQIQGFISGLDVDAFIVNPLNPRDFPLETIEYLKSFNVPIYMSLQGFLRYKSDKSLGLRPNRHIKEIVDGAEAIFLDEGEAEYVPLDELNVGEIIITNGSKGSRILGESEIRIDAIPSDNVVDTTGCGDTFMAAYIVLKLEGYTSVQAANFASQIASEKTQYQGPYRARKSP
ncbi:PfkB family carbohydrate kinase [uncultured Methanobrevibacter sp.]|uniref:PfkB family carbohydrate kinase n=1 Tax=uncultured Methanobrevibacter sp. TaxID=253161 RepID=UPI00260ACC8B|nr:PfkB family carbohydrate kinase [uncultured Methanobrevibacter sp.]